MNQTLFAGTSVTNTSMYSSEILIVTSQRHHSRRLISDFHMQMKGDAHGDVTDSGQIQHRHCEVYGTAAALMLWTYSSSNAVDV